MYTPEVCVVLSRFWNLSVPYIHKIGQDWKHRSKSATTLIENDGAFRLQTIASSWDYHIREKSDNLAVKKLLLNVFSRKLMTARDLVTNLARKWIENREKVWRHMRKNAQIWTQIFCVSFSERNCRKKRKNTKKTDILNSLLPWQRSSEGKLQNEYDYDNVTNLPGEFREHKSHGKNLVQLCIVQKP